jgi:hypothetical protein
MPDDERYLRMLREKRDQIAAGLELVAVDSETIGNKYTNCTWGLCSKEIDGIKRGKKQTCPLQTHGERMGCFHRCLVFQQGLSNRTTALRRYDNHIAALTKEST